MYVPVTNGKRMLTRYIRAFVGLGNLIRFKNWYHFVIAGPKRAPMNKIFSFDIIVEIFGGRMMKKKNTLTSVECKSHSSRKLRRRKELKKRERKKLLCCSISERCQPTSQIVQTLTTKKMATSHKERQVKVYLHHVSCHFLQLPVALKYLQYQTIPLL